MEVTRKIDEENKVNSNKERAVEEFINETRKSVELEGDREEREEWREREEEEMKKRKPRGLEKEKLEEELKERKRKRLGGHIQYEESNIKRKEEVLYEIEKRLRVRIEPRMVKFLKKKQIIIQTMNENEKRDILEGRKIMKGTGIWIREEKTGRELEVERWIRRKAKWEEGNGRVTEVDGKKIKIGEEWWRWNEVRGDLEL